MMEEIKENIKVFIRQRPPVPGDPQENSTMIGKSIVKKDGGTMAVSGIQSVSANQQNLTYFSGISHANHKFAMDRIFTAESNQNEIYNNVARPIVESCLKGYAGLVLAYGPTGSGKTFTMRGRDNEARGIMPRCIEHILGAKQSNMEVWASYLQIYCENISDLLRDNVNDALTSDNAAPITLSSANPADLHLNLRMKPDGSGVFVEGLMRYRIASVEDLFDVLERGDQFRSVAATMSTNSHHAVTRC